MIIDYLVIIIIIVCVGLIVWIVSKKFPILSSINIEILQKYKQEKVKKELFEDRLKRKLKTFGLLGVFKKNADQQPAVPVLEKFYNYLKNLEKKYRERARESAPEEKQEAEKKKVILLAEAKELAAAEQYKEAEEKYIEVISLDSKYAEAYEGLAEVYIQIKDFNHAREIYQYLLKINSQDDSAYDSLGKIAAKEGNLEEAEKDYLHSISLNNEVAGYHVDLGEVYLAMGQPQKAITSFKEAIKLEPNNPRNLDALIEAAIVVKDKSLAQEYYEKLKEVNPENKKLEQFDKEIKEL